MLTKINIALQQEIVRSDESRYDHRLHGVLLVSQGFAGLQEELKSGRPPALNETVISNINSDLRNNPGNFGYSQNLWDGKLLSHHIEKVYQVKLGVRQCQRLFNKLGFRLRKPRPLIAKADEAAQIDFKKTSGSIGK